MANKARNFEIRNSTAEFLIFIIDGKEDGVQVVYRDETIRATQFRQWCTKVLHQFAIRGYVIDRKRMGNGSAIGEDYFEHLLAEIRKIRLSERRFYQKLTNIYSTSIDYNLDVPTTRLFFKKVQNKMHYAIHGQTAAGMIVDRANAEREHMGLTTWENAPKGKIVKTDVSIAKNYLRENVIEVMGRIVSAFLGIAEDMAKRYIPMTMEDWVKRIDNFLNMTEREVLPDSGSISVEINKEFAETEFEKYRVVQDKLFRSDFETTRRQFLTFELQSKRGILVTIPRLRQCCPKRLISNNPI